MLQKRTHGQTVLIQRIDNSINTGSSQGEGVRTTECRLEREKMEGVKKLELVVIIYLYDFGVEEVRMYVYMQTVIT